MSPEIERPSPEERPLFEELKQLLDSKKVPEQYHHVIGQECTSLVELIDNGVMFFGRDAIPFAEVSQDIDMDVFYEEQGKEFNIFLFQKYRTLELYLKNPSLKNTKYAKEKLKGAGNIWLSEPNVGRHWKIQRHPRDSYNFVLRENEQVMLDKDTGYLYAVGNYLAERLTIQKGVINQLQKADISRVSLVSLCFRQTIYHAEKSQSGEIS